MVGPADGTPHSTEGWAYWGNVTATEPERPQKESETKSLLTMRSWLELMVVVIRGKTYISDIHRYSVFGRWT